MKNLLIIPALAFALGGCATVAAVSSGVAVVASADAQIRDRCGYLTGGVDIAEKYLGAEETKNTAANILRRGGRAIEAYCSGKPITNFRSAMAAMQEIIEAVRPLASQAAR